MDDRKSADEGDFWESRRSDYNKLLLAAGGLSFVWFAACVELSEDAEFSLIPIVTVYVIGMALANVCYGLGPLADRLCNANDSEASRENLYALGYWFSFCLPQFPLIYEFVRLKQLG